MVHSSGADSRSTQQSAEAVHGPHGQQHSTATKAVYITCAPMFFVDNSDNWNDPFRWWEQRKHHCCGAEKIYHVNI